MKKTKRTIIGTAIVGGTVCALLGLNTFVFPGMLEAVTVPQKLQTVHAEELPKEKELTVFERMRISTVPVKEAEPDANAISKEKALEIAGKEYERNLMEKKKEVEEWKKEAAGNQAFLEELESYDWSPFENPQKDIKYVAGNAPATEPMWVVCFQTKSEKDELVWREDFLGGIRSSLHALAQPGTREKDPLLDRVFQDDTLTLEDYENPELIGYEEVIGDDGKVYINFGKELTYSFYNINALTGRIISSEKMEDFELTSVLDCYYEKEYGFNPGFDY